MSRLFYQTMQDNAGNLLFDVSGTMRIAGSGTLATIYGDEALTVILPNPMTNHPSFGSFKCFLGVGDYDFYMAKSGYTFETLTGVQGSGSMADQNASNVTITGGTAVLTGIEITDHAGNDVVGIRSGVNTAGGTNRYNLYVAGTAPNFVQGNLGVGGATEDNTKMQVAYNKATHYGLKIRQLGTDTGSYSILFNAVNDSICGSVTTTASATAFNTASDSRLKKEVEALTGELDLLRALRPVFFRWLADDSPGYGFLASEVQQVLPDAGIITGEPDGVESDGRIRPQMIDMSKLTPFLVGAVKTLAAQVESLTARLVVLEDALGI